jgi:uncharacterized protein (UPF0332 family)
MKGLNFMPAEIADLVKYRLDKAAEDLTVSGTMLSETHFATSINRSYYAMFHATRALLAVDRFDAKKHSSIIGYFNQHYIATGKIPQEYHKMLAKAFTVRNNADYEDFFLVSRTTAQEQHDNAIRFIAMITAYLHDLL